MSEGKCPMWVCPTCGSVMYQILGPLWQCDENHHRRWRWQ